MSEIMKSYLFDIMISLILIVGVFFLFRFLVKHLKSNSIKKIHIIVTSVLLSFLCIALLLEVWRDKSSHINEIMLYKKFLPGYDTILLIIAVAIFSHFLQLWLLRKINNSDNEISKKHKARLVAKWGVWGFFFLISFVIILLQTGWSNIGTFLGLIGAGIALSLQESVLSLLGWLYLLFGHTYDIGDRVEIDGKVGDVIGISPTHTRLLEISMKRNIGQSTGRIIIIPNSMVFRSPVYNATAGFPFIWLEITTIVTFESDWEKASEVILDISQQTATQIEGEVKKNITQMQDEYAIHYQYLSPKVYTAIESSGVELTLRFLSPVRSSRQRENDISLNILNALKKHPKIELAYPTTRVFRRNEEL